MLALACPGLKHMMARGVLLRLAVALVVATASCARNSTDDALGDAPPPADAPTVAGTRILLTVKHSTTAVTYGRGTTREIRAGPKGLVRVLEVADSGLEEAMAALAADTEVKSAELDSLLHLDVAVEETMPNTRARRELQEAIGARSLSSVTPGANVSSAVVICVIDSGVDYRHPDLIPYLWHNPGETGLDALGRDRATNGVDDDGNGFVDDVHGIDSRRETGDPYETGGLSHGTHLAGIVAGVIGDTPGVLIMACRYTNDKGNGYTSDAMMCVDYAMKMGAQVVSASWGGHPFSEAFNELAAEAREAGVVIVASAGNRKQDNDATPYYPAGYPQENIISVTSVSTAEGRLSSFASYGATSVDIAAPGHRILSTVPGGGYGKKTGTSQAVAHVAGAAGLLFAEGDCVDWASVKETLLMTATPAEDLQGKTLSGGMLNVTAALAFLRCNDQPMMEHRIFLD